jgi:hypothetical protein
MPDLKKIAQLKEMIQSAERSLSNAKHVLSEILGDKSQDELLISHQLKGTSPPRQEEEGRVIEGIFDGEKMVDNNLRAYPVPANYASKSKLVVGDRLKLTITNEGRFIFKQIGPVERKSLVGPLTFEDGQYKVLAASKAYKALLASVTFFRAEVGDEVTILIPEGEPEVEWGAIEAVLPKFEESSSIEKAVKESRMQNATDEDDDDFDL